MMAEGRKILFVLYANPGAYPPLEYSSRILADEGWDVRFLGVHSHGPQALEHPRHPRISVTVLPFTRPGWRQKVAYAKFLLRARRMIRDWQPDWIYLSDCLAAPVALLAGRRNSSRTAYHEHDAPERREAASSFMRFVLQARRSLVRRAGIVIAPQEERIRCLLEEAGTRRPVLCVWNCPPRHEAPQAPRRERRPGEPLGVYYHGSINLDRVPLALVEGARKCAFPVRLRIVGYETIGSRGASQLLRDAAGSFGSNVTLELRPARPRHELLAEMTDMHVGWMNFINPNDDLNLRFLAGASNKAFDYLCGALPLLVPDAPDWKNMFVARRTAVACRPDNPAAIADAFRWFYENPRAAAEMGERGRALIGTEWNYEHQFAPVKEILDGRRTALVT